MAVLSTALLATTCGPPQRSVASTEARDGELTVAAHIEVLDTLAREPMLVEHPAGALFVSGYNRRRPALWKSTDRGATWTSVPVGSEAEGALGNSDVDLAVANDGTLYFVTMGFDRRSGEGTHIAMGVSRDVGATWRWTMLSRTRGDDRPWVEVAPDGVTHVIWNDGRGVHHLVSRDRGATWVRTGRVHERGGSSHLAVGPRGEVAVRVIPGGGSGRTCDTGVELIAVSTDAGATWRRHPAPDARRPSGCPNDTSQRVPRWVDPLAWDSAGALYALWTTAAGVWVGRSPDQGATWASWRIAGDTASYFPYLAAGGPGRLVATWHAELKDSLAWRAARLDFGAVPTARSRPRVSLSAPLPLETYCCDPPEQSAAGEYLAAALLRDGSLAVVTPIEHASARRLGFSWWRLSERAGL